MVRIRRDLGPVSEGTVIQSRLPAPGVIHQAIFGFAEQRERVWIDGKSDYSVRFALTGRTRQGVSIFQTEG